MINSDWYNGFYMILWDYMAFYMIIWDSWCVWLGDRMIMVKYTLDLYVLINSPWK